MGWVLSVMDSMNFESGKTPAIGIIPLGTGNDLSRSLNWGGKYVERPLKNVLMEMTEASVSYLDRWTLQVNVEPSDAHKNGQDKLVRHRPNFSANLIFEMEFADQLGHRIIGIQIQPKNGLKSKS